MQLPKLTFSYNWNNKLDCLAFTTLRLRNDNKYQVGRAFEIDCPDVKPAPVIILQVKHLRIDQLTEGMCRVDTGYSKAETDKLIRTMYINKKNINWATQQLSWVLLRKLKADEVIHQKEMFK